MELFKIKKRKIGKNSPVFIIAEIGLNHNGSLSLCKKLISKAKECGADAVKLQISDPKYSYNTDTKSYKIFKKNTLPFKDLRKLTFYAKRKKIILFATPGDFKSLEICKKLKFPAIKISSGLLTNEPLISRCAATKLPLILSTGMAFESEIKKAISIIKKNKNSKYAILKCTSLYPASSELINLSSILTFRNKFKVPIGYSDHTLDNLACIGAVALGAKIIEKHFSINKKFKGADHKISAEPKQFKSLVKDIRIMEKLIGIKKIFPSDNEIKNRSLMYRSIITIDKIKKGEKFTSENLGLKRSKGKKMGLNPSYFNTIIGKKSKKDLKKNTMIQKSFCYY